MTLNNRMLACNCGIALLLLLACASSPRKISEPSVRRADSRPVLTGWLTESQLMSQVPGYQDEKNQYQPDPQLLEPLKNLTKDVQIIVFLGTWCSDSQREVPRFLKIMETIQNPHISFEMLALDRTKRDLDGVAEAHDIQFVPTFVVLHEYLEIGRIVEQPIVNIEQDLAEITASIK
jgi:thiol-disulfide isomerase/thioredoxin